MKGEKECVKGKGGERNSVLRGLWREMKRGDAKR